jgi:hypothetical protein
MHKNLIVLLFLFSANASVAAPISFRDETGANAAEAKYGVTGEGVSVVVMDRGIDWDHPDFINPDGTTRIKWLYDMSPDHPTPVEYSEAQINAALAGGPAINERDAVGHGTVTTGLAAGNGRAVTGADFRGMAPGADLIIVKMTSEGAPAHGSQPAESPFIASYLDALTWVDQKITALNQPAVGLINSGVQWGPIDGTSLVSQKIDEVFGLDRPGRAYVSASGDEGNLPNHAKANFSFLSPAVVAFDKSTTQTSYMQMWYDGDRAAKITISFDDGTTVGPVFPNSNVSSNGVQIVHYLPGANIGETWTSSSGDRAVWVAITGHATGGTVKVERTTVDFSSGTVDLYTPIDGSGTSPIPFTDHLTAGRLADFSSTESAIVVGAHVLLTNYTDVNGIVRNVSNEGAPQELWAHSSGGPTRDGRLHGVDVTAPGHNAFAAYAQESYWGTLSFNLAEDGDGWYGRGGATSGSAPMVVGAIALLLEQFPDLTADEIRLLLRDTARTDSFTGATPNAEWGYGKLDILAALDAMHAVPEPGTLELLVAAMAALGTLCAVRVRRSLGHRHVPFGGAGGEVPGVNGLGADRSSTGA